MKLDKNAPQVRDVEKSVQSMAKTLGCSPEVFAMLTDGHISVEDRDVARTLASKMGFMRAARMLEHDVERMYDQQHLLAAATKARDFGLIDAGVVDRIEKGKLGLGDVVRVHRTLKQECEKLGAGKGNIEHQQAMYGVARAMQEQLPYAFAWMLHVAYER